MSKDQAPISLPPLQPSDLVGAVQRRLRDLDMFLAQPPFDIDVNQTLVHLDGVVTMLKAFQQMQTTIKAGMGNGGGKPEGKRAN